MTWLLPSWIWYHMVTFYLFISISIDHNYHQTGIYLWPGCYHHEFEITWLLSIYLKASPSTIIIIRRESMTWLLTIAITIAIMNSISYGFYEHLHHYHQNFAIKSHILRTNIIQNLFLVFPQTFDNVVIGGKLLDSQDHFITNEFVYNPKFVGCSLHDRFSNISEQIPLKHSPK